MHHDYLDIRSRIAVPVLWWDEHAVPRYAPFDPRQLANIYANEAVLALIACQACQTRFLVAFSRCSRDEVFEPGSAILASRITERTLHYGDPPNAGCCAAGPTMNSDMIKVV